MSVKQHMCIALLLLAMSYLAMLSSFQAVVWASAVDEPLLPDPSPHIWRISLLILGLLAFFLVGKLGFRLKCPNCQAHVKATTEVLLAPTESELGKSKTVFYCPNCDYREEKDQTMRVVSNKERGMRGQVITGKETGPEAKRRAKEGFDKGLF